MSVRFYRGNSIDYSDPSTAVLFADGAGAAVLQACEEGGICSSLYLTSDYSEHIYLKNSDAINPQERIDRGGKEFLPRSMIYMPGGPRVLKKAVKRDG